MKITRCPYCHIHIDLIACVQDDAGRELLALLAGLNKPIARAVLLYVSLFRPKKSDLRNDRALRLINESLMLCSDQVKLEQAMLTAHENKINETDRKPLATHNYLKGIIKNIHVDYSLKGQAKNADSNNAASQTVASLAQQFKPPAIDHNSIMAQHEKLRNGD